MASNISGGSISPDSASSFVTPLEHINGFVHLQTLVDIHACLSESERNDDIDLATWIKGNYLQNPLIEEGRLVRDIEGFIQLDAAYRRARQLTGKAQDEWPFFASSRRPLSSTVVRKIVLGEVATGINPPFVNNGDHDSLMTNGFDGQYEPDSKKPKDLTPDQTKPPQSVRSIPINQPRPEYEIPCQEPSPTFKAGDIMSNGISDVLAFDRLASGSLSPAESSRDVETGKVRGPHGRFINNNNKALSTAKKGSNIRFVSKSRSKGASNTESEEKPHSSDDEVRASATFDTLPKPHDDNRNTPEHSTSQTAHESTQVSSIGSTTSDASASSFLAAEAEAVPSNLDRLPPGSVGKKRRSEYVIQQDGIKRARGSRGGVLGRPRKSEAVMTDIQSSPNGDAGPKDPPKVDTRRSSRKSTTSKLDRTNSIESATGDDSRKVQSKPPTENDISTASHGRVAERTNVDLEVTTVIPSATSKPRDLQKTPNSTKLKKQVSFSPETGSERVHFFARISTINGTQDIPLSEEDLAAEVCLVKRFAAWQNSGETSVTFDTFKNIAKFAK